MNAKQWIDKQVERARAAGHDVEIEETTEYGITIYSALIRKIAWYEATVMLLASRGRDNRRWRFGGATVMPTLGETKTRRTYSEAFISMTVYTHAYDDEK